MKQTAPVAWCLSQRLWSLEADTETTTGARFHMAKIYHLIDD